MSRMLAIILLKYATADLREIGDSPPIDSCRNNTDNYFEIR